MQKIKDKRSSFIFSETVKIKILSPMTQGWLGFLVSILGVPGFLMIFSGIFGVVYRPYLALCGVSTSLAAGILFWSVDQKTKKDRQKINLAKISAKQKFFRLYPEYAEILKQAEENGNE